MVHNRLQAKQQLPGANKKIAIKVRELSNYKCQGL